VPTDRDLYENTRRSLDMLYQAITEAEKDATASYRIYKDASTRLTRLEAIRDRLLTVNHALRVKAFEAAMSDPSKRNPEDTP
jgi:hypothetical protein